MLKWTLLYVGLFLVILLPQSALAACANPVRNAGEIIFNADHNVLQYCDGTDWIAMGKTSAAACATTWTPRAAAQANVWNSVTYGNGLFVAVSSSGTNRVMTSPDGIAWTPRTAAAMNDWASIAFGNGLFVAVSDTGTDRVMTSPDGITWTGRSAAEANIWRSVTYGNGLFVAVASSGTNQVMTSPDGINWTARQEAEPNQWESVTYGAGLFVAVSVNGTNRVMTSPDGIAWTPQAAAQANMWASVAFGGGRFIAVSPGGTNQVMASSDGISWTVQSAAEANSWVEVAYGNGLFVAVASTGTNRVMTSPDGIAWMPRAAAEANEWRGIAYGDGLFVAVSGTGTNRVMTAPCPACANPAGTPGTMFYNADYRVPQYCNGSTWVAMVPPDVGTTCDGVEHNGYCLFYGGVGESCTTVCASHGGYDDVGTTAINAGGTTSCNLAMNAVSVPAGSFSTDIGSSLGCYYCTASCGSFGPRWHTSPAPTEGASSANYRRVCACNGVPGPPAAPSCSLGAWTPRAAVEANIWWTVTYGNGLFVALATSGTNRVMTSPDGVTWTPRTAAEANAWRGVIYANGLFVAVAAGGLNQVMTSPDGITWTARSAAAVSGWESVTYGNGVFVAVAPDNTNRVMTSPDGITWTARTAALANSWTSVTYGNGLFVAVSYDGTNRVMTSPDGITWTARTAAEANSWYSVTYGNDLFVAVSQDGTNRVMTSPDGITWTPRAATEANAWRSVTYGNGLFVALSMNGTNRVMASPDGITWTPHAAAEANTWMTVTYGNDLFVAVAQSGTNRVMTADCVSGCTAPSHAAGTLMFNDDCKAVQYCDGADWQAIGKKIDPCACGSPTIGDVCGDGSVYAGLSPDGSLPMFTTPADAPSTYPWNNGNSTNRVTTSLSSNDTGESNTNTLVTIDADSGTGGTQPHQAAQYCYDLVAHGQSDWYLPGLNELHELYVNSAAIGGFKTAGQIYHSATEYNGNPNLGSSTHYFNVELHSWGNKEQLREVRCVRK